MPVDRILGGYLRLFDADIPFGLKGSDTLFGKMLRAQLTSPAVLIALALLMLLCFFGQWQDVFEETHAVTSVSGHVYMGTTPPSYYLQSLRMSNIDLIIQVLVIVVVALEVTAFWKDGMQYHLFSRTSWRSYAFSRGGITVLTGGLLAVIPVLCALSVVWIIRLNTGILYHTPLISNLFQERFAGDNGYQRLIMACTTPYIRQEVVPYLADIERARVAGELSGPSADFAKGLAFGEVPQIQFMIMEVKYSLLQLLAYFVFGAFWSSVALAVSVWLCNRYAVMGMTMLIYQLLDFLAAVVPALRFLAIGELFTGETCSLNGYSHAVCYMTFLLMLLFFFILFFIGLGRRANRE